MQIYNEDHSGAIGRRPGTHQVAPYARGASGPITQAQDTAWVNAYVATPASKGNDPNAAFSAWSQTMAANVPELFAVLDQNRQAQLWNDINVSISVASPPSSWTISTFVLTTLNEYLANPTLLADVAPSTLYLWSGGTLVNAPYAAAGGIDTTTLLIVGGIAAVGILAAVLLSQPGPVANTGA